VTEISKIQASSLLLALIILVLVLELGLLAALLSGLLIYQLVQLTAPALRRFGLAHGTGRTIALAVPVVVVVIAITFGVAQIVALTTGPDSLARLLEMMADVIGAARQYLPAWAQSYLPENIADLQSLAAGWLQEHAGQVGLISQDVGRFLFHALIGMIIGGLVSLYAGITHDQNEGPLAQALSERTAVLAGAFRHIVFSQVRISALNTALTATYLAIILPLLGVQLPLVKTMIAVTFIVGLLPVLGNLISNTVIVVVSLSFSPLVAAGSLVFLVVIHKLEYFVNARIIGTRIRARAWELLAAMLVMEAAFGVPGLIAAPVYYAYLKDELSLRKLI
jgi:predicted PurR-regulated permease PerM